MTTPDREGHPRWTDAGWLARISAWIDRELDDRGMARTGPIEQPSVGHWSTVLRVPTTAGTLYCKANVPALAFEPALTEALWRLQPGCTPRVVAIDAARGWLLTEDAGPTLRSLMHTPSDVRHWYRVLPRYAELQIATAPHVASLLALGAFDRRLTVLPGQYEHLLADTGALRLGRPDGLTPDEHERLRALAPRLAAMCDELAGYGIPETVHHDDFHDANVFVRDGRYVFGDWGESCVAHPFFTLVVTLRSIAYRLEALGAPDTESEMARLRDAYLEPWTRYQSRQALLAACDLAGRVGTVCRALTWHALLTSIDESCREEDAEAVPRWLRQWLDAASGGYASSR